MDPNEVYKQIFYYVARGEYSTAYEYIDTLTHWVANSGVHPNYVNIPEKWRFETYWYDDKQQFRFQAPSGKFKTATTALCCLDQLITVIARE